MSEERFKLESSVHLLLIQDEKVLLLRRFNTGWRDGEYSMIAGHLDGGEPVTDAMIREAKEEGDIDLMRKDLRVVHTMHMLADGEEYVNFFLTSNNWKGVPKIMEPDKSDDLSWFPIRALPDNTIPYIREVIEYYQSGRTFSEYGW